MTSTREILERPFPQELIRHRPGRNGGEEIVYLEGTTVIARLNEAFCGDWSFTVDHHVILEDEVVVLGRFTAGVVTKAAFGSSSITRPRAGGKPVSIGDDLKAAATDALKKAGSLLGVGLQLHAIGPAQSVASAPPAATPSANGNGHLSQSQLRAVHAIRRRLGWSDAQLADFASRVVQVSDVEKLDKRGASVLIDKLQAEASPVGATR